MVLQQFIQDTLFRQQTCCLPQIGVFRLNYTPARYDVTNKTIEPPGETVTFDETLTDDGNLTEWIAQKEHLVSSIAQMKRDKYLEDLRALLKKGQPFEIPGVGKLKADAVGRLSFEQEPPVLTRDILHVTPVIRPDASHKVTVGTREMVNKQVVDHTAASSAIQPPSPVNAGPDTDYPEYPEEMPSPLRWLWVAVPVLSVLTAVAVWYTVSKREKATAIPADSTRTAAVTDTPAARQAPATADTIAAADTTPDSLRVLNYDVIIQTYENRKKGEDMYKKRLSWKQNEIVIRYSADSNTVKLGVPFQTPAKDTAATKEAVIKTYKVPRVFLELRNN